MVFIESALKQGRSILAEFESKQIIASYGMPVTIDINPIIIFGDKPVAVDGLEVL